MAKNHVLYSESREQRSIDTKEANDKKNKCELNAYLVKCPLENVHSSSGLNSPGLEFSATYM